MPAKIYAPPEEIGQPPEYAPGMTFKEYGALIEAYYQLVIDYAKRINPHDPYAGKIYCYPVADGQAQYIVLRARPLTLIHLPIGDAWNMPDVVERGLTLADIDKYLHFIQIFAKAKGETSQ